jgi:hypothetical protein
VPGGYGFDFGEAQLEGDLLVLEYKDLTGGNTEFDLITWELYFGTGCATGYNLMGEFVVLDPADPTSIELDSWEKVIPPTESVLLAWPNPSRGEVRIRYHVPTTPISHLEILDIMGRRVRTLVHRDRGQGWQDSIWDGRGESGEALSAGVYWVRLALPNEVRTARVIEVE